MLPAAISLRGGTKKEERRREQAMARVDGRAPDELRPVRVMVDYLQHAEGSVLIEAGATRVLCAASIEDGVPAFLEGRGQGWLTAEYSMLPRATKTRTRRESSVGRP